MLELDAVQTLAFAGLALFLGYALCRMVPLFNRYNLPAPVIGGLVVALAVLVARSREVTLFTLDTSLQAPLMIAFFTTIGVNASVALLKLSGRQVLVFLLLASAFAIVQNLLGMAVALMNLKLWELAGLAAPLLVNLALQVVVVALFCGVVFRVMGRDYDAAVMGGGFIGFMLGTTANAMAVMRTLVERYGMAPRAFLVAPLVGAFFIDFTNALIITGFINLWD